MQVYQGIGRRQVGGGVWSTIARGIRPILLNIFSKLKPHALSAAKKAASSALHVGGDLAMDAVQGKLNKQRVKDKVKEEVVRNLKRTFNENQTGSGNKRRKVNPKTKANMSTIRKRTPAKRQTKKRAPARKRQVNKRRGSTNKRKRPTKKRASAKRRAPAKKANKRRRNKQSIVNTDIFN